MATPRSQQIDLAITPYYHCMSRCVRRAFLCGEDKFSGQNYNHRKAWVRDRIRQLASVFAIDVCAYAVMSNHLHLVLHVDQPRANTWSDSELVARYTSLYPMAKVSYNSATQPENLLNKWRDRLCDISWLMRALNEYIARKANKEEKVTGRFWEGRFKSQAIVDTEGLLTCMAYVDLNPVRANIANGVEESEFTSIEERLRAVGTKQSASKTTASPHLAPMEDQEPSGQSTHHLPIAFKDYKSLLLWTQNKLQNDPENSPQLPRSLRRSAISEEGWIHALSKQNLGTLAFLGSPEKLEELATVLDKKWLRGIGLARRLVAPRS